ncbi:MAG TPA: peptidoglycan-associated lipoprotein Pal [Thermoanaerobaculia bacterium]|nr:peptidoglycan-associated lipoprotein Pal [Thermoanaerobaculia bacterium]
MRRWMVSLMTIGLGLFLLSGCARKPKPTTTDDLAVPVETSTVPASAPAATVPVESGDDPLAGDLGSVNEYVRSQGLLGDVYFFYDSSELSPEARQRLADNGRFLSQNPQFEALVEGHCDSRGTPEYNLALGERRASAALSYLTALGVDGSRLRTLSYGEEKPVCTEEDESCWSQNRRAHFLLTGRRDMD